MKKSKPPGKLKEESRKLDRGSSRKRSLTPREEENERLKIEAVQALGLWEKVEEEGWGALTSAESGRVGGLMTRMRFEAKRQSQSSEASPT